MKTTLPVGKRRVLDGTLQTIIPLACLLYTCLLSTFFGPCSFDRGSSNTILTLLNTPGTKISISWSGGKDSAYALWLTLQNPEFEVIELHTLINTETQRVGLHGIQKSLIQQQADHMGLPVHFLELTKDATNRSFEEVTTAYYEQLRSRGISTVMFGDIFLEDLKAYRDQMLEASGMTGHYPLWGMDTRELAEAFLENGFESTICAANPDHFKFTVAGKPYTQALIGQFPATVDPCGENGEFHSFVHGGPIFHQPVPIEVGKRETHTYHFQDDQGKAQTSNMEFADIRLKH